MLLADLGIRAYMEHLKTQRLSGFGLRLQNLVLNDVPSSLRLTLLDRRQWKDNILAECAIGWVPKWPNMTTT